MAQIKRSFNVIPDAEVTLEANPGDFTDDKLEAYLDCGFNRLSIGFQSLSDELLKLLGRRHTAADAIEAYRMALRAGFDNISIDLMYGLPHQTLEQWSDTLKGVLELDPPHISMYGLTLEGGTPMEHQVTVGLLPEPDQDLAADMYQMAKDAMRPQGYRHYEISNWAKPGLASRHNLTYWKNTPYIGVGPGAHSYLPPYRFANLKPPREYIRRLSEQASPDFDESDSLEETIKSVAVVDICDLIDHRGEMAETLMMGLRIDDGIGLEYFRARFGESVADAFGRTINELEGLGLLETSEGSLQLTERGRMLGNEVFARFFE